jgi:hypothetical protein
MGDTAAAGHPPNNTKLVVTVPISASETGRATYAPRAFPPSYFSLDALTLLGLIAVSAMLLFYALEARSHWFVLCLRDGLRLWVRNGSSVISRKRPCQ